jgi:hypothetical protein
LDLRFLLLLPLFSLQLEQSKLRQAQLFPAGKMLSNASSGNNSTPPANFNLQDSSHNHQRVPYSDEESELFLSGHQDKDVAVESNQNLKKASFWIAINIIATVLIVS